MKKLDIIFENKDLLVVDKPAGLVVNRSQTTTAETLQDLISVYLKLGKGDLGIGDRAGIVHRLDRETSGLLVVAKVKRAFEDLQTQFKLRQIEKEYAALVHGDTAEEGEIGEPIGRIGKFGKFGVTEEGRQSVTHFKKVFRGTFHATKFQYLVDEHGLRGVRGKYLTSHAKVYSQLSVFPKTGRTHQIRVHLKHVGHPIVSDAIYCPNKLLRFDLLWCPRLFLHASGIMFRDPSSKKILTFKSDLPKDLKSAMLFLASGD